MIDDAEKFKENDKKIKETQNAKNSLENYLSNARHIIATEEFRKDVNENKLKELTTKIEDITNWMEDIEENEEEYANTITKESYDEQYKDLESELLPLLEKASIKNSNDVRVKGKKQNSQKSSNEPDKNESNKIESNNK